MPSTSALIASLPQASLRRLAALGQTRNFAKNTVIINEGDVGNTVYILLAGRVRVYHGTDDGREVVLDVLGPGELIGEMVLTRLSAVSVRYDGRAMHNGIHERFHSAGASA